MNSNIVLPEIPFLEVNNTVYEVDSLELYFSDYLSVPRAERVNIYFNLLNCVVNLSEFEIKYGEYGFREPRPGSPTFNRSPPFYATRNEPRRNACGGEWINKPRAGYIFPHSRY